MARMSETDWHDFLCKPEIRGFNRTMVEYPDDLAPRYVWADWLDEHFPDPEFGALVRQSIENDRKIYRDWNGWPDFLQYLEVGLYRGRLSVVMKDDFYISDLFQTSGLIGRMRIVQPSGSRNELRMKIWLDLTGAWALEYLHYAHSVTSRSILELIAFLQRTAPSLQKLIIENGATSPNERSQLQKLLEKTPELSMVRCI